MRKMTPWFSREVTGIVGAILGGSYGLAGALLGCFAYPLMIRKKRRKLLHLWIHGLLAIAALTLATGVTALLSSQPVHVWFHFTLVGGVAFLVFGLSLIVVRKAIKEAELREMEIKDS